uniref:Uncharacterized protein n=1 Tax=Arundo donax TaxID=35708 RepID=A0A0A9FHD1_ARUDO
MLVCSLWGHLMYSSNGSTEGMMKAQLQN